MPKRSAWRAVSAAACLAVAGNAWGGLTANQVLVVYNSQNADSTEVYNYYASMRPGVLGFDLNNASIAAGDISYGDYISKIRDPLRNYLTTNNLSQQVVDITLTKGLPHRILDMNIPTAGDSPGTAGSLAFPDQYGAGGGNATYASVDSEMTLLWQNLSTGESNGRMDSHADNFILNPYHASTASITDFSRTSITSQKTFSNYGSANVMWKMYSNAGMTTATTAGNMYLTTRLDGNSVTAVKAMIDRAQHITYYPNQDRIILDENDNFKPTGSTTEYDDQALFSPSNQDPGYSGNDYENARAALTGNWPTVSADSGTPFLIGSSSSVSDPNATRVNGPIAMLASFGANHDASSWLRSGYVGTWAGQPVPGAIFNTLESWNGRAFGGLGDNGQGQVSQWIDQGGTFGVGNVWEPFAFSLADNQWLVNNFILGGKSWAEAAWSAIPYLSWQQIVIGDPLATAMIDTASYGPQWRADNNGNWSAAGNWLGAVPDGNSATANFLGKITGSRTISVDTARTVAGLLLNSTASYTIAGPATLTLQASSGTASITVSQGTHTISAPLAVAGNTNISVAGSARLNLVGPINSAAGASVHFNNTGTVSLGSDLGTTPAVFFEQGTVLLGASQTLVNPTFGATARVALAASNVQLNVKESASGSALSDVTINNIWALVRSAYAGGAWNGNGIGSTAITTPAVNGLGLVLGDSGQTLSVREMILGDVNGDNKVTIGDVMVALNSANYQQDGTWLNGDVNYDGKVTIGDVMLMLNSDHYQQDYNPANAPAQIAALEAAGLGSLANTAVPEPASLGVLAIGALGLLARRRR